MMMQHSIFRLLTDHILFTGDLQQDIQSFLTANQCEDIAKHCMEVGNEAKRIALMFGADPGSAEIAGWLHDISAVYPNHERIEVAKQLQIEIYPEEEIFPMIIHQRLSKVMASEIFKIDDQEILDAIGCHTTLRSDATLLDQVLFVADKISWDQNGTPPYLEKLNCNLEVSLTHGAFAYVHFLWTQRENLKVIHPWLREAYEDLKGKVQLV
ncbi:bis(5'-nucleosyl)-tetraphosphatase (symmetrical) YqeK [Paenibacillus aceti]|uniref:bis(5'-nucleosyl)-tetraphosphatase (symmetrical) YqeK n=1 Tax=Paenibacillus aceti TaxID=1820010 RepID=UPI003F6C882A